MALPLDAGIEEASELHRLVVDLASAADPRLLGPALEHLPLVLAVLARLAAVDDGGRAEAPPAQDDDDYWAALPVSAATLRGVRRALRAKLHPVPADAVAAAARTLPKELQRTLQTYMMQ